MKQSSIDWLIEKITDMVHESNHPELANLYEQAKAMHKEETMDAFQLGKWDWAEHLEKSIESKDPAQYYNETFA